MPAAGVIVSPSAIAAYGTSVGEQRGRLQHIHQILSSARVPSNAFGLLAEANGLQAAYTEHAAEVLAVTGQLPGHIGQIAEGLLDTARSYSELEDSMARGIRDASPSAGSGGYAYSAPSSPAGRVISGLGNVTGDAYQAYGWMKAPETGLPALAVTNLDPSSGGITGAISEAVTWLLEHVPVLPKYLHDVTGDIQALKDAAAAWHGAGEELNLVIAEIKRNARDLPESWAGQASEAFGSYMGNVTRALDLLVDLTGQTQHVLEEAAAAANFTEKTISMIISEVLEWIAGNILVDVATAGLATGVEALATSAYLADKVTEAEQAVSRLAEVLRGLERVLKSLTNDDLNEGYDVLKGASGLGKVRKFLDLGKTFKASIDLGKVENLRIFGGGKLASVAKFAVDAGRHGPNAEEVRNVIDVGKLGLSTRIGTSAALSAAEALTGLPVAKGGAGLAKDLAKGTMKDLQDNGQGAADTAGTGPAETEQFRRINTLVNPPPEPREEKKKLWPGRRPSGARPARPGSRATASPGAFPTPARPSAPSCSTRSGPAGEPTCPPAPSSSRPIPPPRHRSAPCAPTARPSANCSATTRN